MDHTDRSDGQLHFAQHGQRLLQVLHDLCELVLGKLPARALGDLAALPGEKVVNAVDRLVVIDGLVVRAAQQQEVLL